MNYETLLWGITYETLLPTLLWGITYETLLPTLLWDITHDIILIIAVGSLCDNKACLKL